MKRTVLILSILGYGCLSTEEQVVSTSRNFAGRVEQRDVMMQEFKPRLNAPRGLAWAMKAPQCRRPLAREFDISLSTVHDYIEKKQRKLLRAQTIDLAAQERDQALELLDNAIEQVVPHINGQVTIETIIERGEKPPITMTVEEWQARMKGCQVLVQLLDRKAKLLGMDAP